MLIIHLNNTFESYILIIHLKKEIFTYLSHNTNVGSPTRGSFKFAHNFDALSFQEQMSQDSEVYA